MPTLQLEKVQAFPAYPSASALEWTPEGLLVAGDDAPFLLLLDENYAVKDTIPFWPFEGRLPKDRKPDLEAALRLPDGAVVVLGSRSGPLRQGVWLLRPGSRRLEAIPGFGSLPALPELNLEGAAMARNTLVLGNRGNLTYPVNHLLFLQDGKGVKKSVLSLPARERFAGLSGLAYAEEGDRLFFTAAEEASQNAYDDGVIGQAYVGWIDGISAMHDRDTLRPTRVIPLQGVDARLANQKVESIVLRAEEGQRWRVDLCADNDQGSSMLFRLRLTLPLPKVP